MESIFDILLGVAIVGTFIVGFVLVGTMVGDEPSVVGRTVDFSVHNASVIAGIVMVLLLLVYVEYDVKRGSFHGDVRKGRGG